jgi:hypothetical protein
MPALPWTTVQAPADADALLDSTNHLHDGCLRELHLSTETFVDGNGRMYVPGHLDSSARLYFHVFGHGISAVELEFREIEALTVRPTPENADSILSEASIEFAAGTITFRAWCIGLPLISEPNSFLVAVRGEPLITISSRRLAWRNAGSHGGAQLKYSPTSVA